MTIKKMESRESGDDDMEGYLVLVTHDDEAPNQSTPAERVSVQEQSRDEKGIKCRKYRMMRDQRKQLHKCRKTPIKTS